MSVRSNPATGFHWDASKILLTMGRTVLSTAELRWPLLGEGAAALGVVLAVEAGVDECAQVGVRGLGQRRMFERGDRGLGGANRERRVRRDRLGVGTHLGLDLVAGDDEVDQPEPQRFVGFDL